MNKEQREQYLRHCIDQSDFDILQDQLVPHVFVPLRLNSLRGALANFILKAQHNDLPRDSVFAALVRTLSPKVEDLVKYYKNRYCPYLKWVLLDEKGLCVAELGEKKQESHFSPLGSGYMSVATYWTSPYAEHSLPQSSSSSAKNLFSPNNQWLLKLLLLSGAEERYWGGPQLHTACGVSDLADAAGVAQSSASRFVALAEEHGFINRSGRALAMQRLAILLDQWVFYLRNSPDFSLYARFRYRQPSPDDDNLLNLTAPSIILGGHLGIRARGLSITNAGMAVVYAKSIPEVLDEHDLVECSKGDAACVLKVPSADKAVFDGSVQVDGHHIADILQLYLDAPLSMARGDEQAQHIFDTVLAPLFREKKWL